MSGTGFYGSNDGVKVQDQAAQGHGHFVNSIDVTEPLKGFEASLQKCILYLGDELIRFSMSGGQRSRSQTHSPTETYRLTIRR